MQLQQLVLLFTFLGSLGFTIANTGSPRINHNMRNLALKCIIFREKKYPKILHYIQAKYKLYYEKAMATISDGVGEYEKLKEEEKILIDFMFSMLL
jgi:signal recognition particle subunit SEC65